MPKHNVVITGVGPVSAIGCSRNDFWDALLEKKHGFGPITLCDASASPSQVAAEVKDFELSTYVANGHILARRTPRPVQLGLAASVLALHDAEIDLDSCRADRLGVYVGTGIGNMGDILSLNDRLRETGSLPPQAAFHAFNHSAACMISSFFNIRGPIHTASSGCNSGIDAMGQSLRMIEAGAVDVMVVIGTDCELIPEVMAALNASGSLTTRYNDDPGSASRPFDRDRDGNVIGEGAGAVVLESERHARARDARIYAKVSGYRVASAGQNRQYSHDSPELDLRPCVRALQGAMQEALWKPERVDVVNANGSSSVIYDRLEALALRNAFGDHFGKLRVHSTKSMLGQHGAGSSILQVVASCLTLRRGTIPPTRNFDNPDPGCEGIPIVTEAEFTAPQRVLLHSIGLGGFYYSSAALEAVADSDAMVTGVSAVRWSDGAHPRFSPAADFQKPLTPWEPRRDDIL